MAHSHRSGGLKQSNKKHKGGAGASKRSLKAAAGGKVERSNRAAPKANKGAGEATNAKLKRLNMAKQTKKQRQQELRLAKRLGSADGPPKIIMIMALSSLADVGTLRDTLVAQASSSTVSGGSDVRMITATYSQYKQRVTLLCPPRGLLSCLEYCKVADIIMLALPVQQGEDKCVDETGELILSALKAQGLPTVIGVTQGAKELSSSKAQADMKKYGQRLFETEFGEVAKVVTADNPVAMVRTIVSTPCRTLHWRAQRSYLVAESAVLVPAAASLSAAAAAAAGGGGGEGGGGGGHDLKVRGFLRGRPLSVNQLVTLSGAGHFRMTQIALCQEQGGAAAARRRPAAATAAAGGGGGELEGGDVTMGEAEGGSSNSSSSSRGSLDEGAVLAVLAVADPSKQEALALEAEVDDLAGEQTWPTEEEMAMADVEAAGGGGGGGADEALALMDPAKKMHAPRPKGWSTYQGAWLEGGAAPPPAATAVGDTAAGGVVDAEDGEEWVKGGEEEDDGLGGSDMDAMELERAERKMLEDRAREDMDFPDEVDTPQDIPARTRFARYRHLKSFRTSPWDAKESLPRDYARVYQFDDFLAVQKSVHAAAEKVEQEQKKAFIAATTPSSSGSSVGSRSRAASVASSSTSSQVGGMDVGVDEGGSESCSSSSQGGGGGGAGGVVMVGDEEEGVVASGQYIEITLANVPSDVLERIQAAQGGIQGPLLLFSLLRFEGKLTVLHFNIQRDSRLPEDVIIPSKEKLVFQCGFRRWTAKPVFSQISLNCEKHKFERFLQSGRFVGASCYGPATFQPAPVLIYRQPEGAVGDDGLQLVAHGSLTAVEPDRIILKKVVLTGYPLRVRKRKAVIKYMFFDPEDVKWFTPTELTTKWGLTGTIREPVGTHGLMKVVFNKPVKQNDIVCLHLYKRVYPKMDGDVVVVR